MSIPEENQVPLDDAAAFEAEMARAMAEEATGGTGVKSPEPGISVQTAQFPKVDSDRNYSEGDRKLDMLMDLTLPVSIELGRTALLIRDIINLKRGSVVELDKLASEPVDILVNGKKMAEGEVVVIEKHFGIRIINLVEAAERIRGLGK
jgi:flagellar motor switch protein FliN/FliY